MLYARCYFTRVAYTFVDDEYDAYEKRTQPTTPVPSPWVDNNEAGFVQPTPNFDHNKVTARAQPAKGVASVSTSVASAPPTNARSWNFMKTHQGQYEDMTLENWNFGSVSRDDTKLMAKTLISTIAVTVLVYMTILYAIVGAIVMFILRRIRKLTISHSECVNAFRVNQVHPSDVSMETGSIRQANGLGFERVPMSEPNEEHYSINGNVPHTMVIPRGVVINQLQ
jgi:hypothetical protein